jgi:hypothetical protein
MRNIGGVDQDLLSKELKVYGWFKIGFFGLLGSKVAGCFYLS